jgi:hypothetical protein
MLFPSAVTAAPAARREVDIDGDLPQCAVLIAPHGAHVFDHEARLGDRMQDAREPVGCVGRFDLEDFRNFHLRGSAPARIGVSVAPDPAAAAVRCRLPKPGRFPVAAES